MSSIYLRKKRESEMCFIKARCLSISTYYTRHGFCVCECESKFISLSSCVCDKNTRLCTDRQILVRTHTHTPHISTTNENDETKRCRSFSSVSQLRSMKKHAFTFIRFLVKIKLISSKLNSFSKPHAHYF